MNSFYAPEELQELGFASVGIDVMLSRKCSIYGASNISIGNHVRIDDFCVLSGKITIGNHVHIAAYVGMFAGTAGIVLDDFSGVSSRCVIYAQSDDYKGNAMTNPTVPDEFRKVTGSTVYIGRHVVIGTGSTILPGVQLAEGSSFGAMTLINKDAQPFSVYTGIPMQRRCDRSRKLLEYEAQLLEHEKSESAQ